MSKVTIASGTIEHYINDRVKALEHLSSTVDCSPTFELQRRLHREIVEIDTLLGHVPKRNHWAYPLFKEDPWDEQEYDWVPPIREEFNPGLKDILQTMQDDELLNDLKGGN